MQYHPSPKKIIECKLSLSDGMDAFGRREVWTILKTLKQHHTIILTSNFMDEAEYLADRIALLSHGKLICFGSVNFLKSQYDTGYFLKLEPLPFAPSLDTNAIVALLQAKLGKYAREKRNKKLEEVDSLTIELPRSQLNKFAEICDELDQQQVALGFKTYSIREVGLSDIFIKICESIASEHDAPDLYVRRDSAGDIKSALTCIHRAFVTLFDSRHYVLVNKF
jgi:ATP-binding cassette subfamily A (ABC1) protein 3